MRCTVRIQISGLDGAQSATIKDALEPDNTRMPDGLAVEITCKSGKKTDDKGTLTLEIEGCDDNNGKVQPAPHAMGHVVGTVDEMLEHVQVAQRVINDA